MTSLSPAFNTRALRVDVADRAWRVIAGNFYDPNLNGVDWRAVRKTTRNRAGAAVSDMEFYAALKDMAAALGDSHTMVLTPRETVDRRRFVSTRTGMQLTVIDERVVVSEVEHESPAARAGIAAGDVVVAVGRTRLDGAFIRSALADPRLEHADAHAGDGPEALPAQPPDAERVRVLRAVRREMRGAAGIGRVSAVNLDVMHADGAVLHAQLLPTAWARPPSAELRWLDGQVALIKFTRFVPELRPELEAALDEANRARAIIVDLRGNGGGLIDMFRWFTARFMPEERLVMRSLSRDRTDGHAQAVSEMFVGPDRFQTPGRQLLQPLAVLIDGRTGSAAELAAVVLVEQRSALLVGEPTCGCVVGVRYEYVLPDGGGVRVAETGFVSAHGVRLEGAPTLPAVRVVPTLADLRGGRDLVLEEAHRRMLKAATR
ncbi:MAG TPA: S41 family peptidase [Burkholderiaceae bacterium]|nr:S41 family peptidase [Burkholderiaceae bacterium]